MNTTVEIKFVEGLENLTSSVIVKVAYFLVFCASQIVNFCCYSGFVYFEHYGGDPMKRSIKVRKVATYLILLLEKLLNKPFWHFRIKYLQVFLW